MRSEAAQGPGRKMEPLGSPISSPVIVPRLFKLSKPQFLQLKTKDNDTCLKVVLSVQRSVV